MFRIELAGLRVRIENRFDYVREICRDYLASGPGPDDIAVSVTDEELQREKARTPELSVSDEEAESVLVCEKIADALPAFDAFVLHAAAVKVDGKAYCFAAGCGTGKSTHTRYWLQVLGDRVTIINGDKPVCRFLDGQLLVFGTPWCGKENWQQNTSAPLSALGLLEQGEDNAVFPVAPGDVLGEVIRVVHRPRGGMLKIMELIDRMAELVPFCRLRMRNDRSAAEAAAAYFGLDKE